LKGWFSPENITRLEYQIDGDRYYSKIEYHGLDRQTIREDMNKCPFCGRFVQEWSMQHAEFTNDVSMTFTYNCACIVLYFRWKDNMKHHAYTLSLFGVDVERMQL